MMREVNLLYLSAGWMYTNWRVKVCLGRVKLDTNCPALRYLSCIRAKHVKSDNSLLEDIFLF